MQFDLTKEQGNRRLLIFFTGWGTTPEVADHLTPLPECDYLTAYDFRTLSPEAIPPLPDLSLIHI